MYQNLADGHPGKCENGSSASRDVKGGYAPRQDTAAKVGTQTLVEFVMGLDSESCGGSLLGAALVPDPAVIHDVALLVVVIHTLRPSHSVVSQRKLYVSEPVPLCDSLRPCMVYVMAQMLRFGQPLPVNWWYTSIPWDFSWIRRSHKLSSK